VNFLADEQQDAFLPLVAVAIQTADIDVVVGNEDEIQSRLQGGACDFFVGALAIREGRVGVWIAYILMYHV
jgi:hypothetical protein